MMYSEFIAGTKCKENEHNYKVFKDLEAMYMNSDLTKEDIYEYGKKLVDNSKSEEQKKFEAEVKAEIELKQRDLEWANENAKLYNEYAEISNGEEKKYWRSNAKIQQSKARELREDIRQLKWVLE